MELHNDYQIPINKDSRYGSVAEQTKSKHNKTESRDSIDEDCVSEQLRSKIMD